MKELGKRIRARRVKLGYSLKRVAGVAGKSHGWLFAIEKGQGNPKAEDITAIALELGEDPKEYLRLAGRVSLAASGVTPLTQPEIPAGMAQAIGAAVAAEMRPLLDRIDQLVALLEADRGER